jgi:hypothetical protein
MMLDGVVLARKTGDGALRIAHRHGAITLRILHVLVLEFGLH